MNKYTEYAEKVVNGDIVVCEYVRLAAKRFLDWFKRDDLEFREKKVDKVVNFIKKLKHFTGQSNGKPFILSDW
jgi:phage terminase large subunit-like protein